MKNLILVCCLLFSSFAFAKPKWVDDVKKEKVCKKKSLCAVATGPSLNFAKRNARTAIAKIFSTEISSKFKSTANNSGEEMSDELSEITEAVLTGVEILKTFEGKIDVYALAAINKKKAAKGFKTEVLKLDQKMKVLIEDNSASSARAAEKLYKQRDALNKRYQFLTGKNLAELVSFEDVFKSKKENITNIVAHVYLDEREPKQVEGLLVRLLSDLGVKVTTGRVRNKKSTHIVTGEIVADKQYMKIAGFEKFSFVLKITAKTNAGVGSGSLTFTTTQTGRSYAQASEKALVEIKKYLKENIENLNIE